MIKFLALQHNCKNVLAQTPKNVRLIAASKTRTLAEVRAAFQAGITHFGENYVQEGTQKAAQLPEATWHFIGKLQTNKANQAVEFFAVFHTVDTLKLLNKLDHAAAKLGKTPEIYIQVNIAHEAQKAGCSIAELPDLIKAAKHAKHLKLVGLMTLPPQNQDPAPYFKTLANLAANHGLKRLSMGTSGDWQHATAHGATDIRLGEAIFGQRK